MRCSVWLASGDRRLGAVAAGGDVAAASQWRGHVRTPTRIEQDADLASRMNGTPEGGAGQDDMAEPVSLKFLMDMCARYMPAEDLALIRAAYQLAAEAHQGVCRKSGEPYIEHPL